MRCQGVGCPQAVGIRKADDGRMRFWAIMVDGARLSVVFAIDDAVVGIACLRERAIGRGGEFGLAQHIGVILG